MIISLDLIEPNPYQTRKEYDSDSGRIEKIN
jgi:ParB-like chromosome segregation protein Spo0J